MAINPYQAPDVEPEKLALIPSAHSLSYRTETWRGFRFGFKWTLLILLPLWIALVGVLFSGFFKIERGAPRDEFLRLVTDILLIFVVGTAQFWMFAVILAVAGGFIGATVMTLAVFVRRLRTS